MITDELLTELVEVLDEELERMATLRFRLIVLGSLMAADQTPWLERSIRDCSRRRPNSSGWRISAAPRRPSGCCTNTAWRTRLVWKRSRRGPTMRGRVARERRLQLLEEMLAFAARRHGRRGRLEAGRLVQEALTFSAATRLSSDYQHRRRAPRGLVQGSM